MADENPQKKQDDLKKFEDLMNRGVDADDKVTRVMDWVFNVIAAGLGGFVFWTITGMMEVSLFQQLFWTLIGAAIGVVAMRAFFFFGRFFV